MPNYGYDLWCTDDLTIGMKEIDGNDNITIVSQSIYRRLTTPRGQLIDDEDYGYDIRGLLHRGMTANQMLAIPGTIKQEILKEERIDEVNVKIVSANVTTGKLTLEVEGIAQEEPFTLTISVDQAALVIISNDN